MDPLGDGTHYYSSTKGKVLITEMHPLHLRNAILKHYQEWVTGLHAVTEPKDFIIMLLAGPDDQTWRNMVVELSHREGVKK
jgi:hypothetical protein